MPPGHPDVSSMPPRVSYKLPAGWEEVAAGQVRVASFSVKDASGKLVEWSAETSSPSSMTGEHGWSRTTVKAGDELTFTVLPSKITGLFSQWGRTDIKLPSNLSLDERLMEVERGLIIEALSKTGGVQSRATELLGINQRSLWHRIKKLSIDVKSLTPGGYLDIEQTTREGTVRVEFQAQPNGAIQRRWWKNGHETSFDPEGREVLHYRKRHPYIRRTRHSGSGQGGSVRLAITNRSVGGR